MSKIVVRWLLPGIWLALATLALVMPALAADEPGGALWKDVRVVTEDLAPLAYLDPRDHTLKGSTAVQVQAAMKRLRMTSSIEVLPWARALKTVQDFPDVFIFNLSRTAGRENAFKWVYRTASKRVGVFALRSRSDIHITAQADLKKYRIVVLNQNIVHLTLLERGFVQTGNPDFYPMSYEKNILPFLLAGRADAWIRTYLNEHDLDEQMRALGEDPQRIVKVADLDDIRVDLYLATSLQTSDEKVLRFREAMLAVH